MSAVWLAVGIACVLWTYGYYLQASTGLTSFSEYHPASQWLAGQWAVLKQLGEMLVGRDRLALEVIQRQRVGRLVGPQPRHIVI